jgi:RNA polymerase sigma factor (TIGR02999 family)
MIDPTEMTRLLQDARRGDQRAADKLVPALYDELRRLATHYLGRERPGHTMQPTALVHELYIKIADHGHTDTRDQAHFLCLGARVLRQVLVDHARRRGARKRGADWERITLGEVDSGDVPLDVDVLVLDEALHQLAVLDPRKAKVVELRFFAGMNVDEVAEALDVSKRTVEADWFMARAWLRSEMDKGDAV